MTGAAVTAPDPAGLAPALEDIVRRAGMEVMRVYATDFEHRAKDDESPVTEADEAAEALIVPELERLAPGVPVVAEEAAAAGRVPEVGDGPFWLVDPLDGTKEFLNRNGEFTVNVALVVAGRPVLGAVLAPAVETFYLGVAGEGAWRQVGQAPRERIAVRRPPAAGLTVVASRRHGDPEVIGKFLKGREVAEMTNAGSSLKFCLVAAGEADLYPRFGRTMEWDTAAGQAVLEAAGGLVTDTEGHELGYAKTAIFENPHFVAWGGVRP